MKLLLLITSFFLISLFLVAKPKTFSGDSVKMPSELALIIGKFWEASLQGDEAGLNEVISKMPDDYYQMFNNCRLADEIPKQVEQSHVKDNLILTKVISSNIKKNNLVSYRIIEERVSGNHAVVRVDYGDVPDKRIYNDLFLMNQENGKWKIFMIDSGWYLKLDNKYFALNDCSEKSVTEPFWRPLPE